MNPYTSDTSTKAEAVRLELIRNMPPEQRVRKALGLSSQLLHMAKGAIRGQYPNYSEEQVGIRFIELHYGIELAEAVSSYLEARNRIE